jgi:hypothetical protein
LVRMNRSLKEAESEGLGFDRPKKRCCFCFTTKYKRIEYLKKQQKKHKEKLEEIETKPSQNQNNSNTEIFEGIKHNVKSCFIVFNQ